MVEDTATSRGTRGENSSGSSELPKRRSVRGTRTLIRRTASPPGAVRVEAGQGILSMRKHPKETRVTRTPQYSWARVATIAFTARTRAGIRWLPRGNQCSTGTSWWEKSFPTTPSRACAGLGEVPNPKHPSSTRFLDRFGKGRRKKTGSSEYA